MADPLRALVETMPRLAAHLDMAGGGSASAKDDLAVVLWLLLGDGDGYGVVAKACDELGVSQPTATVSTSAPFAMTADGLSNGQTMDLALGVRCLTVSEQEPTTAVELGEFFDQPVLCWAHPDFPPSETWSLRDLVKKVRNKFGGHVAEKPPRWLDELRYYPAGGADVITHLFWSYGQIIYSTLADFLTSQGVVVAARPPERYLNGVELGAGLIYVSPEGDLDVRVALACESLLGQDRRPILGGLGGERPFVFGMERDGALSLHIGESGESVAEALRAFLRRPSSGPNRAARRAASRRR